MTDASSSPESGSSDPWMRVRYYGVRGSIPSSLQPRYLQKKLAYALTRLISDKKRLGLTFRQALEKLPFFINSTYGGNTPCIHVVASGSHLILDAGSGIRELGMDLLKSEFGKGMGKAKIFFSHTHWDHIQGLPFFTPLFIPGNSFEFYSCFPDLERRLREQQDPNHFPVDMDVMKAEKRFFQLEPGELRDFQEFSVKTLEQNHPGRSFAYRFDAGGRSFIYCTDVEFNEKNYEQMYRAIDFYRGADVLTFDSQYTLMESLDKVDWGHSSIQMGIDLAVHAGVGKVTLFHYDPTYSDSMIHRMARIGKSYKDLNYPESRVEIIASYEGLELAL